MSGFPASVIRFSPRSNDLRWLLKLDAICFVPARHVRQNHSVAFVKAIENLNRIHRFTSYLNGHAHSVPAVRVELKQTDRAVFLSECGAPHIEDVVQPFQVDGSVHTQIRTGSPLKFAS